MEPRISSASLLIRLYGAVGVALAAALVAIMFSPECGGGVTVECLQISFLFTLLTLISFSTGILVVCVASYAVEPMIAYHARAKRERRVNAFVTHASMSTYATENSTRTRGFPARGRGGFRRSIVAALLCSCLVLMMINSTAAEGSGFMPEPPREVFVCRGLSFVSASTNDDGFGPFDCFSVTDGSSVFPPAYYPEAVCASAATLCSSHDGFTVTVNSRAIPVSPIFTEPVHASTVIVLAPGTDLPTAVAQIPLTRICGVTDYTVVHPSFKSVGDHVYDFKLIVMLYGAGLPVSPVLECVTQLIHAGYVELASLSPEMYHRAIFPALFPLLGAPGTAICKCMVAITDELFNDYHDFIIRGASLPMPYVFGTGSPLLSVHRHNRQFTIVYSGSVHPPTLYVTGFDGRADGDPRLVSNMSLWTTAFTFVRCLSGARGTLPTTCDTFMSAISRLSVTLVLGGDCPSSTRSHVDSTLCWLNVSGVVSDVSYVVLHADAPFAISPPHPYIISSIHVLDDIVPSTYVESPPTVAQYRPHSEPSIPSERLTLSDFSTPFHVSDVLETLTQVVPSRPELEHNMSNHANYEVDILTAVRDWVKGFLPSFEIPMVSFDFSRAWRNMWSNMSAAVPEPPQIPPHLLNAGLLWEMVIVGGEAVFACSIIDYRTCVMTAVGAVPRAYYLMNWLAIVLTVYVSAMLSSLILRVSHSRSYVDMFGLFNIPSRGAYTAFLFFWTSVVISAFGFRISDIILMYLLGVVCSFMHSKRVTRADDNCLFAITSLPQFVFVVVRVLIRWMWISVMLVISNPRALDLCFIVGVVQSFGWMGSLSFIRIGASLARGSSVVPTFWTFLAVLSGACASCVRAVMFNAIPWFCWPLIALHVGSARRLTLAFSCLVNIAVFMSSSDHLWHHDNKNSIPSILLAARWKTHLVTVKPLPVALGFGLSMMLVSMHDLYVLTTGLNSFIYRSFVVGFSAKNVALVFKQYRNWRLSVARWFVPDRLFHDVYWLTATTGAGKSTVTMYANYPLDSTIFVGLGFNVVDVDACASGPLVHNAKQLAEARLVAVAPGGINGFLEVWVPIARQYVRDQLAKIKVDPARRQMKTLVMVHIPDEAHLIGLPICTFLGHIGLNDVEKHAVAEARASAIDMGTTLAFIESDEFENRGVPEIDWTDVQKFLAPIVPVRDVTLAMFPDVSVTQVFVKVDVTPVVTTSTMRNRVTSNVASIPLGANVSDDMLVRRWGHTYVRAEAFSETAATIYSMSQRRMYYDNIPLRKDGVVDWRRIDPAELLCIVYRMELPPRHGGRGIAPTIRNRLDIIGSQSVEEATQRIKRKLHPQTSSGGVSGVLTKSTTGSMVQDSDLALQQALETTAVEYVSRELMSMGTEQKGPAPPLGQFQRPMVRTDIVIHGKPWTDDDSLVYKGKNMMPPSVPSRSSALNQCPHEVAKVIELDAETTPTNHLEALRRYVPSDMASSVVHIVKHGDAASRAKTARQLRGWAIQFTTEAAKHQFYRSLRQDVVGIELIANPFARGIWRPESIEESAEAVKRFRDETMQENF